MHVPPISTGMSTTTPESGASKVSRASQDPNAQFLAPMPPVALGRPDRSPDRRRELTGITDGLAAPHQHRGPLYSPGLAIRKRMIRARRELSKMIVRLDRGIRVPPGQRARRLPGASS